MNRPERAKSLDYLEGRGRTISSVNKCHQSNLQLLQFNNLM
jgi:hypothetical protein